MNPARLGEREKVGKSKLTDGYHNRSVSGTLGQGRCGDAVICNTKTSRKYLAQIGVCDLPRHSI